VVADGRRGKPAALVNVIDDGGEATLLVPRNGEVAQSARGRPHAALLLDANPEFGVGVTLVGPLAVAPVDGYVAQRPTENQPTGNQPN
jgi:hypothetical protein